MDEEGYRKYQLKQVIRDYVLHPELSVEEEAEAERQDQEDIAFDEKVFREKCPACSKQCSWYGKEREKRISERI